ncbi:MAG: preprotein translocase subunit SecG [Candidatus Nealsonbacteria bacterium]|nr:preprotein translocase subunit SecG [Candidatus Nealsonbacteria bacterium]
MGTYLAIAEIIVSILLIIFILIQQRGTALGSAFGGGDSGGFYSTRRGIQQKIFIGTIILGVLFIALAVANLLA